MAYVSHTNENYLWGSVLDLAHTGKQLCRAVQLSRLLVNTDGTAVQFKDGISGGESIQTGPDGHE